MKDKKYQVGIVGMGSIFPHHLAAINQSSEFEVKKVHDINLALKGKAEGLKLEFYSSCYELLKDSAIEVIAVLVPLKHHFNVALKALEAGKHVLLEKPPTETEEQFEGLVVTARRNNRILVTAFHDACGLEVLSFAKELETKNDGVHHQDFGRLFRIEAECSEHFVVKGVLSPQALSLGGSWIDNGINALSVVRQFVPRIKIKEAEFDNSLFKETGREIKARVGFSFRGGEGSIHTTWLGRSFFKKTILRFLDDHVIVLDQSGERVKCYGPNGRFEWSEDYSNLNPRLTNHYIGVYADLAIRLAEAKDNAVLARELLACLLKAYNIGRSL